MKSRLYYYWAALPSPQNKELWVVVEQHIKVFEKGIDFVDCKIVSEPVSQEEAESLAVQMNLEGIKKKTHISYADQQEAKLHNRTTPKRSILRLRQIRSILHQGFRRKLLMRTGHRCECRSNECSHTGRCPAILTTETCVIRHRTGLLVEEITQLHHYELVCERCSRKM